VSDDTDIVDFYVHTVTARAYLGVSGKGVVLYDTEVTIPCFLSRKVQFVRNQDGEQVASSASVSCAPSWLNSLPPKSQVTIPGQTEPTTVISRAAPDGGDFITGMDRVKVYLQ